MLFCLTCSVICWILYFILVIYTEDYILWQYSNSASFNCSYVWLTNLPAFMLSLGVILNLNKWIQYLLKITAFVRVNTTQESQ